MICSVHIPHYENVPFEVPSNWVWTTFKKLTDGSHNPPPKRSNGYTVISAQNIKNGKIVFTNNDRYTDEIGFQKENPRTQITKGDIILGIIGGSIGNVAIYDLLIPVVAQRSISIIDTYVSNIYCFYLLQSTIFQSLFLEKSIGNAQAGVYLGELEKLYIPLPPFGEQQRVVMEIEKWFALINEIEQGKDNLQTIIKQTKSKILDLAIHGKLVPQNPNDEPAIELLKRINPDFTPCDNAHRRKLPPNWIWAKGENIFAPMKSIKPKNNEFQYIDIDSIDNRRQTISEIKTIKTANAPSRASRYTQKNDVVFSMVRPYLRNIAKVTNDNCIASTGFYVCSSIPQILNHNYCYYLMISDNVVNGLNQFMKGDNSPSINKGHIDEWLFPLPPFAEQQRIVQKIEELFSVLDNIQNALEV